MVGWGNEGWGLGPWGGQHSLTSAEALPLVPQDNADGTGSFEARTGCQGLTVLLSWVNPPGVQHVKIVRRLRAWPFDLTDDYVTVYDGPEIGAFTDTGVAAPVTTLSTSVTNGSTVLPVSGTAGFMAGDSVRVETLTGPPNFEIVDVSAVSSSGINITSSAPLKNSYNAGDRVSVSVGLQPQTYYYYLVLLSNLELPTDNDYAITSQSRAQGLSIDVFNSYQFFIANSPRDALIQDAKPSSEGGGDGFLAKWFVLMGCWLDLMHGVFNTISLLGDRSNAPFHTLTALNNDLGIDPEGYAFDFDSARNPLMSLIYVYKRKGTCIGMVETVRMFTKWDCDCVELGLNVCPGGAADLKTYDGLSMAEYGEGPQVTQSVVDAQGVSTLTDSAQVWADDLWSNGQLRGWMGDIACVNTNQGNTLTTKEPAVVTTLVTQANSGDFSFTVASTSGIFPGEAIQLTATQPSSGPLVPAAVIVEVDSMTAGAPGVIGIKGSAPLGATFPPGSHVSIQKSVVRSSYSGTLTVTGAELSGGWIVNDTQRNNVLSQWTGYKLLDAGNVVHNITFNLNQQMIVDGPIPTAGNYTVAHSFTGTSPNIRYRVENGVHTQLFEPTYDIAERGTSYDPYNRLWQGPGSTLMGSFGPSDVVIRITTPVAVILGKAYLITSSTYNGQPVSSLVSTLLSRPLLLAHLSGCSSIQTKTITRYFRL